MPFGNEGNTTATGISTPTTADKHIGEIWVPDVIRAQEFETVIAPRVNRKFEKNWPGHGDVIHIPRIGNIEKTTKTPGSAWTPYKYTDTEQTITINVYEVTGTEIEDITKILSNTDLEAEYKKSMGYALARGVDVALGALFASFSQIVGTYGVEFTWDNLLDANLNLRNAGVSADSEDVTLFLSPAACAGLKKIDQFINAQYHGAKGPSNLERSKFSDNVLGASVFESLLLTAPASGQHDNALFDRRALALVMAQEPKAFSDFIGLDISTINGMYQLYGYSEIDRYSESPGNITASDEWAVLMKGV